MSRLQQVVYFQPGPSEHKAAPGKCGKITATISRCPVSRSYLELGLHITGNPDILEFFQERPDSIFYKSGVNICEIALRAGLAAKKKQKKQAESLPADGLFEKSHYFQEILRNIVFRLLNCDGKFISILINY